MRRGNIVYTSVPQLIDQEEGAWDESISACTWNDEWFFCLGISQNRVPFQLVSIFCRMGASAWSQAKANKCLWNIVYLTGLEDPVVIACAYED
jgi:hypothetical protein